MPCQAQAPITVQPAQGPTTSHFPNTGVDSTALDPTGSTLAKEQDMSLGAVDMNTTNRYKVPCHHKEAQPQQLHRRANGCMPGQCVWTCKTSLLEHVYDKLHLVMLLL